MLSRIAADLHADVIFHKIKALKIPADQKLALLDAVIETVRKQSRE